MSLEEQLKKNTEALEKHTQIMERLIEHLTSGASDTLTKAVGEKVSDNRSAAKQPEETAAKQPEETAAEKTPAKKAPPKKTAASKKKDDSSLSEEEVLKHPDFQVIVKLFSDAKDLIDEDALDEDDVSALLANYEVKSARALQQDQWDDFAGDLRELIENAKASNEESDEETSSFV